MTPSTPTQLSVRHLTDLGYSVHVVEWRDRFGHTHDLFGFLDLVAMKDGRTLGVQTTSVKNGPARVAKVLASEHWPAVRDAGWRIVVHGWRPKGTLKEYVVAEGNLAAGWPEQMELPWVEGVTP